MISLGIDGGSLTTKLVLMEDKRLTFCDIVYTGIDIADSITNLLNRTLENVGLCINEIDRIVATVIGKDFVPYPIKTVTEAKSDATGTRFYNHAAEGVIDIGAKNSRIIKFNCWSSTG
jgi:activator of 2-hydroxyglutaryl-CoA dehydratase